MRPQYEHLTLSPGHSWQLLWRELPELPFLWHYHPEFELTLTVNARGQRYVGDHLADFADGDLILLGPNLPHTWSASERIDPARQMLAVVVWFSRDWLVQLQTSLPELAGLLQLGKRADRGLQFSATAAEAVRPLMLRMENLSPAQRLPLLLELLLLLAQDEQAQPLASIASAPIALDAQRQRMARVLDYMHAHFQTEIPVQLLAERAALSVGAFHRFFKRHTQLTVTAYLAQLRIGSACQLLIQTDKSIGAIAQQAGYRNLAHFNRQFRAAKGVSPREFKNRYR
ncbi:bacterial regulatory helix-turn-helix s, AraC family protein [Collimonas arenae]|uniref:Bacterial regulatory helix-turn-helix s, AraC family protein n=1 Tax=Collimonas arenae TaxID=279058 RepID=A0A127PX59_9BURK|nr:AraC family transcriptional regulator [Collimonas arenae]AMP02314.1 bacterial regulatory helix-turn-helix s, AraC family protein [Collimonas arenae]AMP12210.1 bacterial regulatory helix-turn-helix s, AraC family protein [Collimonas arenae]